MDINEQIIITIELQTIWNYAFDFTKSTTFQLLNNKDKRKFKKIENDLFILMKEYKYNKTPDIIT